MESFKNGTLTLMVIIMLPALANVIMMSVWYSQIRFQEHESRWKFLYGICAASEAFALSMFSLCWAISSKTLWYTFGFFHVAISFIANAVSGAVVGERAFHYNRLGKIFAFAISGLSVVTGILLYKSYKNHS